MADSQTNGNNATETCVFLFVYGTLQSVFNHPMHRQLLLYSDYAGKGAMQGLLYEIYDYPGAITSEKTTDLVHGELYRIKSRCQQALFKRLDAYEECSPDFPEPHEYIRSVIQVDTESRQTIHAWCYLYNHSLSGRQRITDGHYRPTRQAHSK